MTKTMERVRTAVVMILSFLFCAYWIPSMYFVKLFALLGGVITWELCVIHQVSRPKMLACCATVLLWVLPVSQAAFYLMMLLWFMRVVGMSLQYLMPPLFLLMATFFDVVVFVKALQKLYLFDPMWLLLTAIMVSGVDTVGYFVGRGFGKHKLFPKISPNKTLEGYMGALAWLILCFIYIGFKLEVGMYSLTFIALMVYILSITGDLLISYQKRLLGVKDCSQLIPGHGGLLDRFDSWMFVVPFIFFIVN